MAGLAIGVSLVNDRNCPCDLHSSGAPSVDPVVADDVMVSIASGQAITGSLGISAPIIPLPLSGSASKQDSFRLIQLFSESLGVPISTTDKPEEAMLKLLTNSSVALLLSHVSAKTLSDVLGSMAEVSEAQQEVIKKSSENKLEKIMEDIKKQQEAKKSGVMGQIFGWIATSLAVVTAVITMQPALIAAAVIMVTMQALSQAKVKVDPAASWTMMGASIALSLGACMPEAIATAATKLGAETTAKVASLFFRANTTFISKAPRIFAALQITEGATSVVQGGFGINSAMLNKEDAALREDMKRIEAFLILVQDPIEKSTDLIDEIVKKFQGMLETFAGIVSADIASAAPAQV